MENDPWNLYWALTSGPAKNTLRFGCYFENTVEPKLKICHNVITMIPALFAHLTSNSTPRIPRSSLNIWHIWHSCQKLSLLQSCVRNFRSRTSVSERQWRHRTGRDIIPTKLVGPLADPSDASEGKKTEPWQASSHGPVIQAQFPTWSWMRIYALKPLWNFLHQLSDKSCVYVLPSSFNSLFVQSWSGRGRASAIQGLQMSDPTCRTFQSMSCAVFSEGRRASMTRYGSTTGASEPIHSIWPPRVQLKHRKAIILGGGSSVATYYTFNLIKHLSSAWESRRNIERCKEPSRITSGFLSMGFILVPGFSYYSYLRLEHPSMQRVCYSLIK